MVKKRDPNIRPVFRSGEGQICPRCENPVRECSCVDSVPTSVTDGVIRIRREVKGRRGKTVTTIRGIPGTPTDLKALLKDLKKQCGSGGALKDDVIEIQGDHVDKLVRALAARGFTVR